MRQRESLDEELEVLSRELRRLPTPMAPEALASRVSRLAHLELAGRAEKRLDRLVLALLLLFAWTLTVFPFLAVRLLTGESLFGSATWSTLSWSATYLGSAWISAASMLVLLGLHVRKERRRA